jgi:hypothetical protein
MNIGPRRPREPSVEKKTAASRFRHAPDANRPQQGALIAIRRMCCCVHFVEERHRPIGYFPGGITQKPVIFACMRNMAHRAFPYLSTVFVIGYVVLNEWRSLSPARSTITGNANDPKHVAAPAA